MGMGPYVAPWEDPAMQQTLVQIGDITVTPQWVITPSGNVPLAEAGWSYTDMSHQTQTIPTWAIVMAVVFFFACFLGLLFLLAKETTVTGHVQVTVHGRGFVHTTMLPVGNRQMAYDFASRVNYARSLTASLQRPM